ncbi:MAG: hypothetical protein HY506_01520 [Candidatus Yanofskybacteria bacterium]|nr:hypothetical protein [Candidatus Yanofskybacteria bacterium]
MPEKFDSFDPLEQHRERAKELLGLNKKENPIDPQKVQAIFTTPETRKVFEQIDAATMPRKGAIEHKKRTVLEVREKNLIDQEVLKNNPTVYVGAGIDFEYPLSLGARDIILVDPILKEPTAVQKLKERVKTITGTDPNEVSETEINFQLNDEDVSIKFAPALYGSPETVSHMQGGDEDERGAIERLKREIEANPNDPFISDQVKEAYRTKTEKFAPDYVPTPKEKLPRFVPPENIGMILGFRTTGIDIDDDKEAMGKLADGGYVLVDNVFSSFLHQVSEEEMNEYMYRGSPREKEINELLQRKWKERGFDFIPLENERGSYQYTFIRKNLPPRSAEPNEPAKAG